MFGRSWVRSLSGTQNFCYVPCLRHVEFTFHIVYHCCKSGEIPIFQTLREKKIGLGNREFEKLRVKLQLKNPKETPDVLAFHRMTQVETKPQWLNICQ